MRKKKLFLISVPYNIHTNDSGKVKKRFERAIKAYTLAKALHGFVDELESAFTGPTDIRDYAVNQIEIKKLGTFDDVLDCY